MSGSAQHPWKIRFATEADIPGLEALIPLSVHGLQSLYYSDEQRAAALGPVFAVDHQLIAHGTYFAVEAETQIVGAGGWSKRLALFGGGSVGTGPAAELDPRRDSARIRAFFVHPNRARQGIGRAILAACERSILQAGFRSIELVGTLAGEPFYAAFGYQAVQRYDIEMAGGLSLPAVRMAKHFTTALPY
jgi:GNAT superfamily N-acetyltransferase